MSASESESEEGTPEPEDHSSLYDPPSDEGEDVDPEATKERETLHLNIPKDLAGELLDVATHLGLSPSMVASRAIDLVCDEVATIDKDALSSDTMIQQYQARLDILHTLEDASTDEDGEAAEEDDPWAEVDEIIRKAEGKT